jgi:hypothetical protein
LSEESRFGVGSDEIDQDLGSHSIHGWKDDPGELETLWWLPDFWGTLGPFSFILGGKSEEVIEASVSL